MLFFPLSTYLTSPLTPRPPPSTNTQLALCLIQSTLVWWKKTHRRSYELVSLLGLWLVPAAISAR